MTTTYKVRNAEGLFHRGKRRYRWESNWTKVGKTWSKFGHALQAASVAAFSATPEELAGIVIVEYSPAGERTISLTDAAKGRRFSQPPVTATFVFESEEARADFLERLREGADVVFDPTTGEEFRFLDYGAAPERIIVREREQ